MTLLLRPHTHIYNESSWTPVILPTLGAEIRENKGVPEPSLYKCVKKETDLVKVKCLNLCCVFWINHSPHIPSSKGCQFRRGYYGTFALPTSQQQQPQFVLYLCQHFWFLQQQTFNKVNGLVASHALNPQLGRREDHCFSGIETCELPHHDKAVTPFRAKNVSPGKSSL